MKFVTCFFSAEGIPVQGLGERFTFFRNVNGKMSTVILTLLSSQHNSSSLFYLSHYANSHGLQLLN